MKPNQLLMLAGLSMSALLFSCDREDVLPGKLSNPSTGTPPPAGNTPPPTTPPANDPPATPPPVTSNSLLTEMGERQFVYDTQNRLVEVKYSQQPALGYNIVYDGNKPVRINLKTGGWMLYTYNGDKVSEIVSYYGDNLVNYRYNLEYSGNLLVKKTSMSYARYDEGQLHIEEFKYDASGNMTEYASRWSSSNRYEDLSSPSIIRWGNYDKQPNPMPYIEFGFYLPGIKWSTNNPGYRDTGGGKEFYTYVYHDSGMPQQRYTKLEAFPWVGAFIEKYSYQ
ncbi:hypothetical protein [uncultured Pontibacter sp.]|uniref:hypothetical protein n=1 Tax=uncultured Pontibacter sp. TaxID=453356 RepID=UPI00261CE0C0|nr:hypothetical protein [uncultured Pontibacter sp.]